MSYVNGIGSAQPFAGVQENVAPANDGRLSRSGPSIAGANANGTTSVSAAAGMLAGALAGSDVRMDRVTALQASIGAGTYHVSAAQVAGKMLSMLLN